MKLKRREIIFASAGIVVTLLLIVAINMLFSQLDEKVQEEEMVADYLEVDKALRTKEACDEKKSAESCLKTGIYYLDGKHVLVNREKAARYLLKACEMNNAVGCYQLGKFWMKSPDENVMKNKKALKYFSKACKFGDLESCKIINVKITGE